MKIEMLTPQKNHKMSQNLDFTILTILREEF